MPRRPYTRSCETVHSSCMVVDTIHENTEAPPYAISSFVMSQLPSIERKGMFSNSRYAGRRSWTSQ